MVMAHLEGVATRRQMDLIYDMIDIGTPLSIPGPNIDLALAAITWSAGLPATAGQTIFALARLAGWTAHYLEELNERGLRFRARAVYSMSG
jgi:citrate synthase